LLWAPSVPPYVIDGTSGSILGLYGAFVVLAFFDRPRTRGGWIFTAFVALQLVGSFVYQPLITIEIHAGGAVAGFVLTLFVERFSPREARRSPSSSACTSPSP
jgi:membrane associated rhomboid family serine protease